MKNVIKILILAILGIAAANAADVTLNFTDNSENELGFNVERRDGTDPLSPWVQIAQLAENVTTYVDTTVEIGETYTYRVNAYNHSGVSDNSNTATHTVVDPKYFEPFEPGETPGGLSTAQQSNGNVIAISAAEEP